MATLCNDIPYSLLASKLCRTSTGRPRCGTRADVADEQDADLGSRAQPILAFLRRLLAGPRRT
jgi:hypothetical protein